MGHGEGTRKSLPAGSNRNTLSSMEGKADLLRRVVDDEGKPHNVRLLLASSTPIQRHTKVKGEANPYDPVYENLLRKTRRRSLWRKRFGVRGLFAFSGSFNAGSAPCATPRSPGSRAGAFITASLVCRVVPRVQTTEFCFIQRPRQGSPPNTFPYRKPRLPERGRSKGLSRMKRKLHVRF